MNASRNNCSVVTRSFWKDSQALAGQRGCGGPAPSVVSWFKAANRGRGGSDGYRHTNEPHDFSPEPSLIKWHWSVTDQLELDNDLLRFVLCGVRLRLMRNT